MKINQKFNEAFLKLLEISPMVESVDNLVSEKNELAFIKAFREVMRLKNTMNSFADFDWEDLAMDANNLKTIKANI